MYLKLLTIKVRAVSTNGRGGENRTPIKSFGDSYATIIPHPWYKKDYTKIGYNYQLLSWHYTTF